MVMEFDDDCKILKIDVKFQFLSYLYQICVTVKYFLKKAFSLFMKVAPCLDDRFIWIEGPLFCVLVGLSFKLIWSLYKDYIWYKEQYLNL